MGRLFGCRQIKADLYFGNFAQGSDLGLEHFELCDQGAIAAPKLFDAARDDVDWNIGFLDDFEGAFDVVVHMGLRGQIAILT